MHVLTLFHSFRYQERHWHQNWTTLPNQQHHGSMIFLYGCRQRHLVAVGNLQMVLIVHQMTRLELHRSIFFPCQCFILVDLLSFSMLYFTADGCTSSHNLRFCASSNYIFWLILRIIVLKWPQLFCMLLYAPPLTSVLFNTIVQPDTTSWLLKYDHFFLQPPCCFPDEGSCDSSEGVCQDCTTVKFYFLLLGFQ